MCNYESKESNLSENALIALSALRSLAYREYAYGRIPALHNQVEVKAKDFWKLCNTNGDYRTKESIKKVIREELNKEIIHEDKKSFSSTSFVNSFRWSNEDEETVTFVLEDDFVRHTFCASHILSTMVSKK